MNIPITVICATLSLITLLLAIIPIIISKRQLRHALRPIEYYPPRGFSPIDVLIKYYGFRAKTHELLNPIMLYWADRGFITIEEDCKRGLKLTKLRELEQSHKRGNKIDPEFDLYETQSLIASNFSAEKTLFDDIFRDGDVFYTLAAKSSHLSTNDTFVKKTKENAAPMKTKLSTKLSLISFIFAVFAVLVAIITCAAVTGGGPIYLTSLFAIIALIALHFLPLMPSDTPIKFIMYPFFAVWGGAPFGALLAMSPSYAAAPLACTAAVSVITIIFLSDRIDFRSPLDLQIYGHIMAFKTFLLEAEADRINTLVEQNPNYYYDVLPYCYILKITKKLKAKFDHVALDGPSWYLGDLRNKLMF